MLGVDYPGLVPRPGKSVRGTLVQNLTRADVDRLDAFEGDVSLWTDCADIRNMRGGM